MSLRAGASLDSNTTQSVEEPVPFRGHNLETLERLFLMLVMRVEGGVTDDRQLEN